MLTFISLLRGINVSGQKQIHMDDLRTAYETLGFEFVRSYVQSGNILFATAVSDPGRLSDLIQAQIKGTFGFTTPVIIRSATDLEQVLAGNPYLNERQADPASLHVTFLSAEPSESARSAIVNPSKDGDEFVLAGDAVYVFCPNGYGRTKLNNTFFEKKLDVSATTRNWKTVTALYKMAVEPF
jgi:uncharacterized protein (DUF1697 family)